MDEDVHAPYSFPLDLSWEASQHEGYLSMDLSYFVHLLTDHGFTGMIPLMVAMGIFAMGMTIHIRNLDARWRRAYLALSLIPVLLGIDLFCGRMAEDIDSILGTLGENLSREPLLRLSANLPPLIASALATMLLFAGSALFYLPIRSRRPGSVAMIWACALILIAFTYFGTQVAIDQIRRNHAMSHRYFHTEPGWISALFALITQPVSGFLIGFGLILFGLASRHAPHRQRLAIAFAILAMAMLMSTISALMVVKEIVMFHRSHPAVHGSTWFTSLKIESW